MKNYEVILCIVNRGFADLAMDAARAAGAKGGTVLHGRGTAAPDAEKLFGITIQPEKEIVMILVAGKIRDAVLKALYDVVGTGTDAQGLAFSLPVEQTAGLSLEKKEKKPSAENESVSAEK